MQFKTLLALLLVPGFALADDAAILRCRVIADGTARLACYDAIVAVPSGGAVKSGASNTAIPPQQSGTSTSPARPQPSPAQQKTDQFGLEQKLANKDQLDAIESHIPGSFEGWNSRSVIRLANGQAWQIADDSSRSHYVDNPKVRIRRGALGSFYLEIQGTNVSPRVKRVQ